jgi:predicted nucleic acid-binding protein
MEQQIIYPDSSLILSVFWDDERGERARAVLKDTTRRFVVSDYTWLETMPKAIYNKQHNQAAYINGFFRRADFVPVSGAIVAQARDIASTYGLAAMDALHVAAAIAGGADELVTFEKSTKPFFRIPSEVMRIRSLSDA